MRDRRHTRETRCSFRELEAEEGLFCVCVCVFVGCVKEEAVQSSCLLFHFARGQATTALIPTSQSPSFVNPHPTESSHGPSFTFYLPLPHTQTPLGAPAQTTLRHVIDVATIGSLEDGARHETLGGEDRGLEVLPEAKRVTVPDERPHGAVRDRRVRRTEEGRPREHAFGQA